MSSSAGSSNRDTHAAAQGRCPGSRGDGLDLESYNPVTNTAVCPSCDQIVRLLPSGFFPRHLRCEHEHISRVAPLYVDGRPLYKCDDCGARCVYEDDEPSSKALVPLRSAEREPCECGRSDCGTTRGGICGDGMMG